MLGPSRQQLLAGVADGAGLVSLVGEAIGPGAYCFVMSTKRPVEERDNLGERRTTSSAASARILNMPILAEAVRVRIVYARNTCWNRASE